MDTYLPRSFQIPCSLLFLFLIFPEYLLIQDLFTHLFIHRLKLNGTHQLLAYADDVNILGGNAHTVKENAETLVGATEETGLEVNADKTKYMIMSRDQNAGRSHSMKIYNNTIERVEEFKYLGTTLTNKNSIQEEIKSRLKLGNACYYSVQFAIQKI